MNQLPPDVEDASRSAREVTAGAVDADNSSAVSAGMSSDPVTDQIPKTPERLPAGLEKSLHLLGFLYRSRDELSVTFVNEKRRVGRGYGSSAYVVPLSSIRALEEQLSQPVVDLPDHFGFACPESGYFEVIVANVRSIRSYLFEPFLVGDGDDPSITGCRHVDGKQIPTIDLEPWKNPKNRRVERVHVSDPEAGICVEVSRSSPCGVLFSPPNGRLYRPSGSYDRGRMVSTMSLKVDIGKPCDVKKLIARGTAIADSLLFEINVRNGLLIEPVRRAEFEREVIRIDSDRIREWRFPRTSIQHEVAELFSFAESARENPPLAFLSFYQVLEYFFPSAIRRNAIRRVRKEIADPRFVSSSDAAILRILAASESVANSSEVSQIGTLISDSVRDEKLAEFFENLGDQKNFTKNGPISGVEHINVKNTQKPLKSQVADRIYQIRNRIVHAKDDPKYSNVRVLLPKSREAYALSPDIALVRLLAAEVIIDSQIS